jgi:transposase-like protein
MDCAVEIDVPRDRAATFEPQIVRNGQRRRSGVDEIDLSLYAKGLTTDEISAYLPRSTVHRSPRGRSAAITDRVLEEMNGGRYGHAMRPTRPSSSSAMG